MISELIKKLRNITTTHNGAKTHKSSLHPCLDMFFLAGASRDMSETDIQQLVLKAFQSDSNLCCKILFWARNIRWGAGERRFFRVGWNALCVYDSRVESLRQYIPVFGRWDDVWADCDEGTIDHIIACVRIGLAQKDALLAKRLPRQWREASVFAKKLWYTPRQRRKTIVALSKTVEQQMCANQRNNIAYSSVPSCAFHCYKKAFMRQDPQRFASRISDVTAGKATLNASVLYPYQIYQSRKNQDQWDILEAQRKNLASYETSWSMLPICDVSWSMQGLPMDVSISLWVYLSEKNTGHFQNAFMTFSATPTLQYLSWSLDQKFHQVEQADRWMNTDLEKTFELILSTATTYKIPPEDMPQKVLIISDMEFDEATGWGTHREMIKRRYCDAWYILPFVVFWNVHGRIGNVPATWNEEYVWLVSWYSPSIITSIMNGVYQNPYELMLAIVHQDAYSCIKIQ